VNAPLVHLDDQYDADYASDGASRFGAYLRQRARLFADDGAELSTVTFAALAWQVANAPVMCPGYVRRRGDIEAVRCWHADEPGRLLVDVEVRVRLAGLLDGPAAGWASWVRGQDWEGGYAAFLEPGDTEPAVLATTHLRVPIAAGELLEPKVTRLGAVDVGEAKAAVSIVCRLVNATAGPVVDHLREVAR
jgi:hypothetical protein